jgi:hypothetical protein
MSGEEKARLEKLENFLRNPPLKPGGGFFVNRLGGSGE